REGALDYRDERDGTQLSLSGWQLDTGEITVGSGSQPLIVRIARMTGRFADAQFEGGLTMQKMADQLHANGPLSVQVLSVRKLVNVLEPDLNLPRDPATLGPLDLQAEWAIADGGLVVRPLTIRMDGVTFAGWLERKGESRAPWTFELRGDRIDLS